MSQNGKLMPNLDQQGTKLLNLTVLQRIDSYVEEILITAAHVTFYEFNIELSQWSRKDVEGSLFVVKRSAQPRFQFIVMNRRNTENLVENLLGDFEYEVQVPYLIYRNGSQEVNGIWFYNTRECEEVANLFSRILNAYSKVPQKPKVSPAKSEFEELEAVPTLAAMDGPLEPAPSIASNDKDIPNDSVPFVNFFANVMNVNKAQPYQSSSSSSAAMIIPHPRPPSVAPLVSSTSVVHTPCPVPAPAAPLASSSLMPLLENSSEIGLTNSNHWTPVANLVKPSFFSPTPSSSVVPPPVASSPLQFNPYGSSPFLQPFPPPTPSLSLAPPVFSYESGFISKEKVRAALLTLVQDDQFIDMIHRALLNAHHS